MHFGFEPGALLADADIVIVLESDVPWLPQPDACAGRAAASRTSAKDPFYVRYPMRSFPAISRCRPARSTRWKH